MTSAQRPKGLSHALEGEQFSTLDVELHQQRLEVGTAELLVETCHLDRRLQVGGLTAREELPIVARLR